MAGIKPSVKKNLHFISTQKLRQKAKHGSCLVFQGETGLRGEIGNPGRDGARVSRILFLMFVLKFCFYILLILNSANFQSRTTKKNQF